MSVSVGEVCILMMSVDRLIRDSDMTFGPDHRIAVFGRDLRQAICRERGIDDEAFGRVFSVLDIMNELGAEASQAFRRLEAHCIRLFGDVRFQETVATMTELADLVQGPDCVVTYWWPPERDVGELWALYQRSPS